MGLILPQMVEVMITNSIVNKYIQMGYFIQTHVNKNGKEVIIENQKILVHVLDLSKSSNQFVKVQCDICGKVSLVQYHTINRIHKEGNYSCRDCCHKHIDAENNRIKRIKSTKIILIEELTNYINKFGYPNSLKKCFKAENNLHSIKSYETCFGGGLDNWIEQCGFKLSEIEKKDIVKRGRPTTLTKENVEKLILDISKTLNRPLMYDDFRKPKELNHNIGIAIINKFWGSLNKMKDELGLEIIQENMNDRKITIEEALNQISLVCNYINKLDDRTFVTSRDFDTAKRISGFENIVDYSTLYKMLKNNLGITMSEYIETLGYTMGKQGAGISYTFDDGEHTTSQFEYMFSKFIKDFGLVYNKDYFRDIKYSEFIADYKGNMNCDYVIIYKGKTIYIEIAGIIENYKLWYYDDKPITYSKSKESYRLKLKEKEQMFKDNNLIYFILFPCDLSRDIFIQIFNDGSLELKHNIEKFMKNNIDWVKIQDIGELRYKENETSCYGQLVVDYTERNVS